MATNSVTWTGSYGQYSRIYIELTLASQNVGNNTSTFSYKVRGQSTDVNAGISWYSGSLQLSNAYSKTKAIVSGSFNYSTEFVFDSGTFPVEHDAEGKLSARTLTAYVTLSSGHNATVSVSLTVPTIPRASQPSLNVSTQNLGSSITISTNRASSSFTHTLTYSFGNQSGTIATGVTTSQAWTLPVGLASAIPDSPSGVGTITCTTYNGSTTIGSKSTPFTATVPDNATFQPTANTPVVVAGNTLPSGITAYVQNRSTVNVTSSGTGKFGAGITAYTVVVGGVGTYYGSPITSGFLAVSGTIYITLTVTDSRGFTGSSSTSIYVQPYSPPQLLSFSAVRDANMPTNIVVSYNASVSSVANQNGVFYQIRSLASGGSWAVNKTVTTGYSFSGTQTIVSDPDKSYTIEIYVADTWTAITQTVQVGTAFTMIDFNDSGKGMAIGKVSESDIFEVALPSEFISPATIDTYPIWHAGNSNTMTTSGSNANGRYVRFSDGTQICYQPYAPSSNNETNGTLVTFPAIFLDSSYIVDPQARGMVSGSEGGSYVVEFNAVSNSSCYIKILVHTPTTVSAATTGTNFGYIAIGRWK